MLLRARTWQSGRMQAVHLRWVESRHKKRRRLSLLQGV
ncbi:hypothetical protein SynSYN20_02026 [Synechococcus sp. SYN20]|nr:hypothetical protein SynSYN20_02026 [Synechococcus sp. SYN20]